MIKGRINIARILLSGVLFLFSSSLYAENSTIHRQLSGFIEQQIRSQLLPSDHFNYQISPINQQLQLSHCSQPLDFQPSRPLGAGKFSIKVSCSLPKSWSFYARGTVNIFRSVVTVSQALPKGMPLTPENTELKPIKLQKLRNGYYTTFQEVMNFTLKRPVSKGDVLTPQLLTPPLLVKKGDEVTIIAGKKGLLEVRVTGIAMQDGRRNQQISIRNLSSGKTIKARVTDRGTVRADY